MAELVDRAYLELDGEVIDCDKISWKINGGKEIRKVMNKKNRGVGHKHGVPDYEITCSFPMDLELETKFWALLTDNTAFTVVVEHEGQDGSTKTMSFLDAEVYDISGSAQEGSVDLELTIKALDMVVT